MIPPAARGYQSPVAIATIDEREARMKIKPATATDSSKAKVKTGIRAGTVDPGYQPMY